MRIKATNITHYSNQIIKNNKASEVTENVTNNNKIEKW